MPFEEYGYEEVLVEVAWWSQYWRDHDELKDEYEDSMEEKIAVFELAQEIYGKVKEKTYEMKIDFYEDIATLAEDKFRR